MYELFIYDPATGEYVSKDRDYSFLSTLIDTLEFLDEKDGGAEKFIGCYTSDGEYHMSYWDSKTQTIVGLPSEEDVIYVVDAIGE